MAKVPDLPDNEDRCICHGCPTYPREGLIFCSHGRGERLGGEDRLLVRGLRHLQGIRAARRLLLLGRPSRRRRRVTASRAAHSGTGGRLGYNHPHDGWPNR